MPSLSHQLNTCSEISSGLQIESLSLETIATSAFKQASRSCLDSTRVRIRLKKHSSRSQAHRRVLNLETLANSLFGVAFRPAWTPRRFGSRLQKPLSRNQVNQHGSYVVDTFSMSTSRDSWTYPGRLWSTRSSKVDEFSPAMDIACPSDSYMAEMTKNGKDGWMSTHCSRNPFTFTFTGPLWIGKEA